MSNAAQNAEYILIVDDSFTNLSVLSQALKEAGFTFWATEDSEDAIDVVQRKPPALILLDVQMPKLTGFEVCQRLKANPSTQNIPIIFMTAQSDTESKVKGLSLGAVDYLSKPFDQKEAIARIRVHLELKRLTDQLQQRVAEHTTALADAQVQIIQQEKLSSLGQLLAGVAHEINNPLSCIINNIAPAQQYTTDLINILEPCQHNYDQLPAEVQSAMAEVDLAFILKDLPSLLKSMKVSTERLKDISTSLRTFARSDQAVKTAFDIHDGLESTLLILRHRLKAVGRRPEIEVIKQYGDLPKIDCYSGLLNQVFMNILANAVDALEETWERSPAIDRSLVIEISTGMPHPNQVEIRVADNGLGIAENARPKIFERLFTTKEIGKGTGMGLAIAQQIVVERHGGSLDVHSMPGQGAEFIIQLPIS